MLGAIHQARSGFSSKAEAGHRELNESLERSRPRKPMEVGLQSNE